MKRMAFLIAGAALILSAGATPALADNGPHVSTAFNTTVNPDGTVVAAAGLGSSNLNTDRCAGCHRAHTAQGAYLLTATDETALCNTCHGTDGAGATTDVAEGVAYNTLLSPLVPRTGQGGIAGALRAGGFQLAALGNASVYTTNVLSTYSNTANVDKSQTVIAALGAGVQTTSAHNLGGGLTTTAFGNGAIGSGAGTSFTGANTLECTSCHNPHGNGNYRILRPVPTGSGVALSAGITITDDVTKHNYVTSNYWLVDDPYSANQTLATSSTSANNSSTFLKNISAWCGTCHTRILDPSSSWAMPLAKPGLAATNVVGDANTAIVAKVTISVAPTDPNYPFQKSGYLKVSAAQKGTLAPDSQVVFTAAAFTGTNSTLYGLAPNLNEEIKLGTSRVDADGTSTDFLLLTQAGGSVAPAAATSAVSFSYGDITVDSTYAFRHRSDNGSVNSGRIQWAATDNSTTQAAQITTVESQNNPNCITCHVAHGSNVSMAGDGNSNFSSSVQWPGGTTGANNVHGTQDSFLLRVSNRGMCKLCHNV